MSLNQKNIPFIEITSDDRNNDIEENNLNIEEVKTDIEILDSDNDLHMHDKKISVKNNSEQLIISNEVDDGSTDIEDLEESDDEKIEHNEIFNYSNIDESLLEAACTKATNIENIEYQDRITSNSSNTLDILENTSAILTDVEYINTSNDEPDDTSIDINLSEVCLDDANSVSITDNIRTVKLKSSDNTRNDELSFKKGGKNKKIKKPNRKPQFLKKSNPYVHLTTSSLSPHLSDLTDTEIIYSDSDDNINENYKQSPKKRRSRASSSRAKEILTDTEDIYLSDNDRKSKLKREISLSKKPEFSGSNILKTSMEKSNIIDSETNSDTDNEIISFLTTPQNKKNIKYFNNSHSTPAIHLTIHNSESVGALTDVDDFEADDDEDDSSNLIIDPELTGSQEQLFEIESCCTTINEEINTKNIPDFYITETFTVTNNKDINKITYTIEDLEEIDMEFESSESENDINETVFHDENNKVMFFTSQKTSTSSLGKTDLNKNKTHLIVLEDNNESVTDVENLNSSDDESAQKNEIPIAIFNVNKYMNDTDSETVDTENDDLEYKDISVDDLGLPKPVCEQITIKYNETGHPNITIEPLADDKSLKVFENTWDDGKTDTEDLFCDENILESYDITINSEFKFSDDEQGSTVVTNSEFGKQKNDTIAMTTYGSSGKLSEIKKINELEVELATNALTDREDVDISDIDEMIEAGINVIQKNIVKETIQTNRSENKTDIEDVGGSDEDLNEIISLTRSSSTTPDMMNFISGNTIISKESDNNNLNVTQAKYDYKEIPHIEMTSATPDVQPTDTEDVFTSADEDFVSTYSRAETATPLEAKTQYDDITVSQIHVQCTGKFDETEEILHIKGGCYLPDIYTDVEELGLSDEDIQHEHQNEHIIDKSVIREKSKPILTYRNQEQSPARTASRTTELQEFTRQTSGEIEEPDTALSGDSWDQAQSTTVLSEDVATSANRAEIEEAATSSTAYQASQSQRDCPMNQQELSDEMKELLREMEEQSHK